MWGYSGQKWLSSSSFKYGLLAEMLCILHVVECQVRSDEQQVEETERMKQHDVCISIFILEIKRGKVNVHCHLICIRLFSS